ncbi:MAG: phage gp6-like head-tail connector protein [Megasphaera micronuciformis]|nr:phage gp6-like head-tail connector protein [Megasphaera micronuciformis]DAR79587.1 MAG TPA: head tail connector [Caudoviricetes sp.]DAS15553.1 MAG TPA: head tail connector [Caudoviricetes sp.]DAS56295.1 MAG TPA: head tail connector [Caudoviricetes sp.]DAX48792.1 MAG TPA: head tail connector [Caudoviricetes sp.]
MLLNDVKLYLRVDDYTEDEVIQGMIDAAKQYIQTGTGVTFDETNARHLLTLKMIVAHWYDNRGLVGNTTELPFTVTAQLLQIEAERSE